MPVVDRAADNGVDVLAIDDRSIVVVNIDVGRDAFPRKPSGKGILHVRRVRRVDITQGNQVTEGEGSPAIARALAAATDQCNLRSFVGRLAASRRRTGKDSQRSGGRHGGG